MFYALNELEKSIPVGHGMPSQPSPLNDPLRSPRHYNIGKITKIPNDGDMAYIDMGRYKGRQWGILKNVNKIGSKYHGNLYFDDPDTTRMQDIPFGHQYNLYWDKNHNVWQVALG